MARRKKRNTNRSNPQKQNIPVSNDLLDLVEHEEITEEVIETPEEDLIVTEEKSLDDPEGDALIESALDKLRKEKEAEDESLLEILEENDQDDLFIEDVELTTANLFNADSKQDLLEKTQELDAISKYEGQEPLKQNLLIQEAKVKEDEGSSLKTRQLWASLLVAAVTVLAGAIILLYIYNRSLMTPVVEPVTQAEETVSEKLEAFADDYEKMTQEERLELLDLNDEYKSLTAEEQEEINTYFLDKTGESYRELYSSLTLLKNNLDNESSSNNSSSTTTDDSKES